MKEIPMLDINECREGEFLGWPEKIISRSVLIASEYHGRYEDDDENQLFFDPVTGKFGQASWSTRGYCPVCPKAEKYACWADKAPEEIQRRIIELLDVNPEKWLVKYFEDGFDKLFARDYNAYSYQHDAYKAVKEEYMERVMSKLKITINDYVESARILDSYDFSSFYYWQEHNRELILNKSIYDLKNRFVPKRPRVAKPKGEGISGEIAWVSRELTYYGEVYKVRMKPDNGEKSVYFNKPKNVTLSRGDCVTVYGARTEYAKSIQISRPAVVVEHLEEISR